MVHSMGVRSSTLARSRSWGKTTLWFALAIVKYLKRRKEI
jgi:hypothetical protein